MSGHTPGPWTLEDHDISAARVRDGEEYDELIATAYSLTMNDGTFEETDESRATARLISAAPDLLEALNDCLLAFSAKNLKAQQFRALASKAERTARAAIKKAIT